MLATSAWNQESVKISEMALPVREEELFKKCIFSGSTYSEVLGLGGSRKC